MTGYQQQPSLVSAGIVDYVPLAAGIDMVNGRASDKEAADKWGK